MVAVIKGTSSDDIFRVLEKISLITRNTVIEITLDMANNMESAAKRAFPNAVLVTDRFHVIKLATDALQHIRITERWKEIDAENEAIKIAKEQKQKYKTVELENGDSPKQLLARCRLLLYMKPHKWIDSQKKRIELLFERYPEIEKAYYMVLEFRNIYENKCRIKAEKYMTKWIENTENLNISKFNTVCNTLKSNLQNILNFFIRRNTNANAESFNAKLKLFRANQRGVVDNKFFLFRIAKLFA